MIKNAQQNPLVAIACGGTGGHLFPGIAVAEELLRRDCDVTLLVSAKEVDQQAVRSLPGIAVQTVPAVALTKGNVLGFAIGFWNSYRLVRKQFAARPPKAVLSMGGFTSAAPAIAARGLGAKVFLHESNTIPGKANKWLAHFCDEAFVYFHDTSSRLSLQKITSVGMPVRSQFLEPVDALSARMALGLDSNKPVLLVMGGSQGASGVNDLAMRMAPVLRHRNPDLQILHLTGTADAARVREFYQKNEFKAVVHPFLTEMELALGAATVAISRSGASSLAEIAAMKVPTVLIPYPHAADDHQLYNALGFAESGAALMFDQKTVAAERLAAEIDGLLRNQKVRAAMQDALARWHEPLAAEKIATRVFDAISTSNASRKAHSVTQNSPNKFPHLEQRANV